MPGRCGSSSGGSSGTGSSASSCATWNGTSRHLARKKKLSAVSISTYLTSVRRFFDFLVREGMLKSNPAKQVEGNKRPREHSRDPMSDREIATLLAAVELDHERGLRDHAILKPMIGCALSEIEIVRADIGDLSAWKGGQFSPSRARAERPRTIR